MIHISFRTDFSKLILLSFLVSAVFIPMQSLAVTPDSLKLIKADTRLYNSRMLSLISASNIDKNLNEMIRIYKKEQGGLIPSHLNLTHLKSVFSRAGIYNARTFDKLAQNLKNEFSRYYTKNSQGYLSYSERKRLGALELETAQWIMDFLIVNTTYDHDGVGQKDPEVESLYRLFLGKETSRRNQRVHVCSSISEAAVILGVGEFGMRQDSLKVHNVFEDYKGNKYPDSNGIGHVALGFEAIDKKKYMFDQSSRPMKKPHRLVGPGETLAQITQEQLARVELNRLHVRYKEISSQNIVGDAQKKVVQMEALEERAAQLLGNPALDRHDDLEKSVAGLYEVLQSSLHKNKIIHLVSSAFENINQRAEQAKSAFQRKRWRESERLYSLLVAYVKYQITLLTPVLMNVEGLRDGDGNPVNGRMIIHNFKDSIEVFQKNIKAAANNYSVEIQRKEFNEYKTYEARFNGFGKTISSLQVWDVINKLKVLKDEVRGKINSRMLQPQSRNYYIELDKAITRQIENLIKFARRVGA